MSKFSEITIEENNDQFNDQEKVYLSPKKDFPMNKTFEYRIIDANPMRQLFRGNNPVCTAFDAENGRTRESLWKETKPCSECEFKKGVMEGENKIKCQLKLSVLMEHEDPEKVYEVKLPYGSYIEFSKYVKELHAAGTDVPNVMTKITRIENPSGNGGLFTFEMGDPVAIDNETEEESAEVVLNEAEEVALAKIEAMGEEMDVEFAAKMLMKTKSLEGISYERALAVVNTKAKDGVIGA